MEARDAAMNLKPLNENGDEQEGGNRGNGNGGNGGNGNGGNGGNENGGNKGNGNGGNGGNRNGRNGENGNGNRNGNHDMNYGGFMLVARECTFQDFLKCKPHNYFKNQRRCRIDPLVQENGDCVQYQLLSTEVSSEICYMHTTG
ncbi:hypothetical protein Tco_0297993 [Tanacetum coccineum]